MYNFICLGHSHSAETLIIHQNPAWKIHTDCDIPDDCGKETYYINLSWE